MTTRFCAARAAAAAAVFITILAGRSPAQPCEAIWETPYKHAELDGPVFLLRAYTDPLSGRPALFAHGDFQNIGAIAPAKRVATWDGQRWSPMGAGLTGEVLAAIAFDDSSGPALFIGGPFTINDSNIRAIARWRNGAWDNAGAPSINGFPILGCTALLEHDDGAGSRLYALAYTHTPAGQQLLRWNGATWDPVGGPLVGNVYSVTSINEGPLRAIYVGGSVLRLPPPQNPGNRQLLRLVNAEWQPMPAGQPFWTRVDSLASFAGPGETTGLYALNQILGSSTIVDLHRWDGTTWTPAPPDVPREPMRIVRLAGADRMYFTLDDGLVSWDGVSTRDEGPPQTDIKTFEYFTPHAGSESLHIGGPFPSWPTSANRWDAPRGVAVQSGDEWVRLTNGLPYPVDCLSIVDLGDGPMIHAAMDVNENKRTIIRLEDERWRHVTTIPGENKVVSRLVTFDTPGHTGPPTLYATFGTINPALDGGDGVFNGIAKWDGVEWTDVGGGLTRQSGALRLSGEIFCAAVFDDASGAGPRLYVGGHFDRAGDTPLSGCVSWDGAAWSDATPDHVLTAFDFRVLAPGAGPPALYAAGSFRAAGELFSRPFARLVSGGWSPLPYLPNWLSGTGLALTSVRIDGAERVAGARFSSSGSSTYWLEGDAWRPLLNLDGSSVSGDALLGSVGEGDDQTLVAACADYDRLRLNGGTGRRADIRSSVAMWHDGHARWGLPLASVFEGIRTILPVDDATGTALWIGGQMGGFSPSFPPPGIPGGSVVILRNAIVSCTGDTNLDGAINIHDLNAVLGAYGADTPAGGPVIEHPGDINLDGYVDFFDLALLLAAFGSSCE